MDNITIRANLLTHDTVVINRNDYMRLMMLLNRYVDVNMEDLGEPIFGGLVQELIDELNEHRNN